MEDHMHTRGRTEFFYHRSCSIPGHWYRRGYYPEFAIASARAFFHGQYDTVTLNFFARFRTLFLTEFRPSQKAPIYAVPCMHTVSQAGSMHILPKPREGRPTIKGSYNH